MKKILLFVAFIVCCSDAIAQKIIERKNKLLTDVIERFQTMIEADRQVKQGAYTAVYDKTIVIAKGKYINDKKVGTWHYFDRRGDLAQNYDYDNNKLLFEAPEDKYSTFKYTVDYELKENDVVTPPVRHGGRYFGYIPYLMLFKWPKQISSEEKENYKVVFELLISPMGRLADIIIHIRVKGSETDVLTYNPNLDLLAGEDKTFIPATLNKNPIAAQIHIPCYVDPYEGIKFY